MGRHIKDLMGKKFRRLTVIRLGEKLNNGEHFWLCQCKCGNLIKVRGGHLRNGHTKSCGCLRKEQLKTHGMSQKLEYKSWAKLKGRCLNKNIPNYKDYGGRGITICEEWKNSFETFYKDMGNRPKGTSIDRIDNNENYCKENCRWSLPKVQARNKRNNIMITYKGNTLCSTDWASKLRLKRQTLEGRLRKNWSVERAFTQSLRGKNNFNNLIPRTICT